MALAATINFGDFERLKIVKREENTINKPFLLFKRYKTELKGSSLIGMRCLLPSGSTVILYM